MKILADVNGWQRIFDIEPEIVKRGVINICIMPTPLVDCGPQSVPNFDRRQEINLTLYSAGVDDERGLPVFNNKS